MRIPKVKPRRIYDRAVYGPDLMESDADFVANNMRAAVWFLENRDRIAAALREREAAIAHIHWQESRP